MKNKLPNYIRRVLSVPVVNWKSLPINFIIFHFTSRCYSDALSDVESSIRMAPAHNYEVLAILSKLRAEIQDNLDEAKSNQRKM